MPRIYAVHREEDEPVAVLGWGLAFANGETVTLWYEWGLGSQITMGCLSNVEEFHAPNRNADIVWLTGPTSPS